MMLRSSPRKCATRNLGSNICSSYDSILSKMLRHIFSVEHGSNHIRRGSIHSFCNSVLPGSIRILNNMCDSTTIEIILKLFIDLLPTAIRKYYFQTSLCSLFGNSQVPLECCKDFRFRFLGELFNPSTYFDFGCDKIPAPPFHVSGRGPRKSLCTMSRTQKFLPFFKQDFEI